MIKEPKVGSKAWSKNLERKLEKKIQIELGKKDEDNRDPKNIVLYEPMESGIDEKEYDSSLWQEEQEEYHLKCSYKETLPFKKEEKIPSIAELQKFWEKMQGEREEKKEVKSILKNRTPSPLREQPP